LRRMESASVSVRRRRAAAEQSGRLRTRAGKSRVIHLSKQDCPHRSSLLARWRTISVQQIPKCSYPVDRSVAARQYYCLCFVVCSCDLGY